MTWAEELKKEYQAQAEKRILNPMQEFAEGDLGNTRDKLAKDLEMGSGETYRKAEFSQRTANKFIKCANEFKESNI